MAALSLAASLLARSVAAAEPSYDFAPVTDQIQRWVDKGYYSRASLLIAKDGRVVCEKYFGTAKPETVEYIASSGKWLAAATIAGLADDGKLSLEDPALKWLPEFTGVKGRATVRQMFAHTSGYQTYQPKGNKWDDYQTLKEAAANIAPLEPAAEPGVRWDYGGLAMQVAGRIAEVAGGKDWETLFQERIARPLQMKDTHFTPVDAGLGHNPMLGGGARSTLHDYANFLAMISGGGVFDGKRVLSEKVIAEMQADQVRGATVSPDNFVTTSRGSKHNGVYGLGEWREIEDAQGRAVLISSPSWAGTYPWIDKRHNVYAVFLSHVNCDVANKDKFLAMPASATLPELVAKVMEAAARK
jgi:CubicO group peptidase (beta-lactamase class C family)